MIMERLDKLIAWAARLPRKRLVGGSIALAAILFVSLNIFSARALDGLRADVTDARVWTLSDGTRELLQNLAEPLHLRLFLSEGLTEAAPQLAAYAERVRGTLETYAGMADGAITLEVISPEPFSNDEDRAVGFGINRIALQGASEPMYFGLAATNSTDGQSTIPVFSPDREAWPEYDLTRLIAELGQPEKPKVALIDGLGLAGNPMMRQPAQQSLSMLRELYDVELLSGDVNSFPAGTEIVAVVHPQGLSDKTLYALDQWVLGGGGLMAFVDPQAETQVGPRGMPATDSSSDLARLFKAWGVEYDPGKLVADPQNALTTVRQINGRRTEVGNPAWLRIGTGNMAADRPVLARLSTLIMTGTGSFSAANDEIKLEPLVTAGDQAGIAAASESANPIGDPRALLENAEKPEAAPILAARLSGKLKSAFPNGKPEGSEWSGEHVDEAEVGNVMLVADADMLMDRNWIRHQQILGSSIPPGAPLWRICAAAPPIGGRWNVSRGCRTPPKRSTARRSRHCSSGSRRPSRSFASLRQPRTRKMP